MISEALLVRLLVPWLGEVACIRLGLIAFSLQALCIAGSTSVSQLLWSIPLSMLSNLVYPSVSSLVSRGVQQGDQGEALGALNGIKAVTEGVGPLAFGTLMALFETTSTPGAPYVLAAGVSAWAALHSYELPLDPDLGGGGGGLELPLIHHPQHPHHHTEDQDGGGTIDTEPLLLET